jgi:hypothetical protein
MEYGISQTSEVFGKEEKCILAFDGETQRKDLGVHGTTICKRTIKI